MTLKWHIHNRTPINIKVPISKQNKGHFETQANGTSYNETKGHIASKNRTKTTVIKQKLFLEDGYNTNHKHSFEIRKQWNKNRARRKTTTEMNRATKRIVYPSLTKSEQIYHENESERVNLFWPSRLLKLSDSTSWFASLTTMQINYTVIKHKIYWQLIL